MTKTQLLDALRSGGEDAVRTLRALPASAFDAGRYENGWDGKQILAHIASIEWTYPRLLDVALAGDGAQPPSAASTVDETKSVKAPPAAAAAVRRTTPEEGAGLPTRTAQGGIDSYNDRQIQKRADASAAELIAEFEKNRAATVAAVASADDDLFARPIRSAGGITGKLGDVLNAVAVQHVAGHVADITGSTGGGQ